MGQLTQWLAWIHIYFLDRVRDVDGFTPQYPPWAWGMEQVWDEVAGCLGKRPVPLPSIATCINIQQIQTLELWIKLYALKWIHD